MAEALADGTLVTASREVLSAVLEPLAAALLPAGPKLAATDVRASRLVRRLLDWLKEQPGDDWQQRWESWIGQGEQDWRPSPGSSGQGVKWETSYAIDALIIAGAVSPSYEWMISKTRMRLWKDWATHHEPENYAQIVDAVERRGGFRATTRVVTLLAMMSIWLRKTVPDLTAQDFRDLREIYHARGIRHHGLPKAWTACKDVGLLPGEPASYAEVTHVDKITPAQLVDRHGVRDPRLRRVFIAYLTEMSVSCDYSTLNQLEAILVKNFWGNIQQHYPDIDTLHLTAEQATGWRTRIKTLDNGKPRKDWAQIMDRVRTFYNDLAAWAMEDPGMWAEWVAPNPIPRSALKGARSTNTRRQQNDFKQRTRTLAPWIPQLVASVTADKVRMAELLAAAEAVDPGTTFRFEDQQWLRRDHLLSARGTPSYTLTTTLVVDPAGDVLNLSHLEHKAYWTWAALEVLRHAGLRIEEVLELTHLSVRPLRKQEGQIVPLLQVAPSKTDEERILPMSPALAKVISDIITRHQTRHGQIPLLRRLDRSEREFSHPLPFLFQHHFGTGSGSVFSDTTIRKYLAAAAARAGLRDSDGTLLRPTPHDFRRLYLTELVANKLPIHIAAQLAGHRSLNTTQGYVAIYPQDVFDHYDEFLERRRAVRPSDEYREPTAEEIQVFADHFGRRQVELGDCVRPYGSGCKHEHACIRCDFLAVHPDARQRLDTIEVDLQQRIETAKEQNWLADVEQLRVTMRRLGEKRTQIAPAETPGLDESMSALPAWDVPDVAVSMES
ncbi:site-specific integrase [Phycicoccus sp. MAQZ13P-2]|uniref:site-specific integrase n=1 Tax=Phycicoccus mangrovi TaxID=2840470 RepID=UPI001C002B96|nr:site-specific integrase [Phycicoccus mangrovi]MBT9257479.1 site-specific integrase [Phycicoccus mangrovi]MBT9275647.1 site-specific integrase [Phycicoccus mangrovi]